MKGGIPTTDVRRAAQQYRAQVAHHQDADRVAWVVRGRAKALWLLLALIWFGLCLLGLLLYQIHII